MEQWIKVRANLETDYRVTVIADRLKQHPTRILGCLCVLWFRGDTHTEDGFLPGFTRGIVDKEVGLKGFAKELEQCQWLEFTDDGARIVDFRKHNGEGAKGRAKDLQRKYKDRNNKRSLADGVSN
ncbi:MAG: hypothetical protein ACOYKN_15580 [Pirellula sp.]